MAKVGSSPDAETTPRAPEGPAVADLGSPSSQAAGDDSSAGGASPAGGAGQDPATESAAADQTPLGRRPTDPLDPAPRAATSPPGAPLAALNAGGGPPQGPADDDSDTGRTRPAPGGGPPPPPPQGSAVPPGAPSRAHGSRSYSPHSSRTPSPSQPDLFYEVYDAPVLTPPPWRRAPSGGGSPTTRDSLELILDAGPAGRSEPSYGRSRSVVPPAYGHRQRGNNDLASWDEAEPGYAPRPNPVDVETLDTGYGAGPPNRARSASYGAGPGPAGSAALAAPVRAATPPQPRPIPAPLVPSPPLAEGEWDDQPTELYEGRRQTPRPTDVARRATTSEALVLRPAAGAMEAFGAWVSGDFDLAREISSADLALQAPVPSLRDPDSLSANRYRMLGHLLEEAAATSYCRSVAVTSAGPGDGKSVTALNLALILSEAPGRRVALLDCNFRRPAIANMVGLSDELGLLGVFQRQLSLVEALVRVADRDLFILPAGGAYSNPSEVLRSPLFLAMVRRLEAEAHMLVVDTPPLVPTADVSLLARLVDRLVVVVRAGHTPKRGLADALQTVDEGKLLGLVINEVEA